LDLKIRSADSDELLWLQERPSKHEPDIQKLLQMVKGVLPDKDDRRRLAVLLLASEEEHYELVIRGMIADSLEKKLLLDKDGKPATLALRRSSDGAFCSPGELGLAAGHLFVEYALVWDNDSDDFDHNLRDKERKAALCLEDRSAVAHDLNTGLVVTRLSSDDQMALPALSCKHNGSNLSKFPWNRLTPTGELLQHGLKRPPMRILTRLVVGPENGSKNAADYVALDHVSPGSSNSFCVFAKLTCSTGEKQARCKRASRDRLNEARSTTAMNPQQQAAALEAANNYNFMDEPDIHWYCVFIVPLTDDDADVLNSVYEATGSAHRGIWWRLSGNVRAPRHLSIIYAESPDGRVAINGEDSMAYIKGVALRCRSKEVVLDKCEVERISFMLDTAHRKAVAICRKQERPDWPPYMVGGKVVAKIMEPNIVYDVSGPVLSGEERWEGQGQAARCADGTQQSNLVGSLAGMVCDGTATGTLAICADRIPMRAAVVLCFLVHLRRAADEPILSLQRRMLAM
jgi:hypothetical protein